MGKGITHNLLRKMLTVFMTLVFFYLVIGDLITFHQRAIFDYDIFATHPFSKPNKHENIFKIKDKKDRVQINLLTFVSSLIEINNEHRVSFDFEMLCFYYSIVTTEFECSSISHRGPPRLL